MPATQFRQPTTPSVTPATGRGALLVKLFLGAAALLALVLLGRKVGAFIPEFATWVESLGVWGPVAFILGYAIATVAFVPGSLLTLAAGAIFGLAQGTIVVFLGAVTGTALAFLVARYVARAAIERKLESNARFASIDRAVAKSGLKIVFLLRLSPAFPYNLLNYALGLTSVRFRDYLLASIGMLPGTFLYVYYGKVIGNLAALSGGTTPEGGIGRWILIGVGLAATIAVTTIVTRIARRALDEEVRND
jgi:uncharacterized membrane protein YdjX (TVP38/TMEM64 family)